MRKCRLNRLSKPFSRLEIVPRPKPHPLALLAFSLALALGLAACGGGSSLLSGTTATEINSNLEEVRELVAENDCAGADEAVAEVSAQVDALKGVDSRLKEALEEGAERLEEVVSGCEEVEGEEETEPLEETEETEARPTRPDKTEKEEKPEREPTEKEPTEPEQSEPTTPEKQEPSESPTESEAPSGGVGPSTPAGEG